MMYHIKEESIGSAWVYLVELVEKYGFQLADEGKEVNNVTIQFTHDMNVVDPIIEQHADKQMIANMEYVFFGIGDDRLGHSYKDLMQGPLGLNDFTDVVQLLKEKKECKRATVIFKAKGTGKVPCINVVNFLVRDEAVQISYYSRGQDAYKKFFADAIAIAKMQSIVAQELGLAAGDITGFIASAHNYSTDSDDIYKLLESEVK